MLAVFAASHLPSDLLASGPLVTFRHLGFERFDFLVLGVMAGRMAVAAALGAVVAFRPWRRAMSWQFEPPESGAQVLIAVAGGLMASVIGNNVALAFALVGLGGFIRFRSGIKDPREAGVMFLMIAIGMACGIGALPIAMTATLCGAVLLTALDVADRHRRKFGRRRIRFLDVADPRQFEPLIRTAVESSVLVHGSRISLKKDEVVVDVFGDRIASAGQVIELLEDAGVPFGGDVSVEEI